MKRLSLSLLLAVGALLAFAGGSLAPSAAAQPAPDDPCAGAVELGALALTPVSATGHLKGVVSYPFPDQAIGGDVYHVTALRGALIDLEVSLAPGGALPGVQVDFATRGPDGVCQTYGGLAIARPDAPGTARFPALGDELFLTLKGCCGDVTDPDVEGDYALTVRLVEAVGPVTGRLVDDATGAPVVASYSAVWVERADCPGTVPCYSSNGLPLDAEGGFIIAASDYLQPGVYRLGVNIPGYAPYRSGTFDLALNQPYELGEVRLARGPTITGRLVDAGTGAPIQGFFTTVELSRCESGACSFVTMANILPDGSFSVGEAYEALVPGDYRLDVRVPGYEPRAIEVGGLGAGEERSLGDIALTPLPRIAGVKGQLVDAVTGRPISGSGYAFVWLYACESLPCLYPVAQAPVGPDGRFLLDASNTPEPLGVGGYVVGTGVEGYITRRTPRFTVGADQLYDLGRIKVQPQSARWDEPFICQTVPPGRERCEYGATLQSVYGHVAELRVWSTLTVMGAEETTFQPATARLVRLRPGASKRVTFTIDIPSAMPEESTLCARLFAAPEGRGYAFNPMASTSSYSLCVTKRTDGALRRLTPAEVRDLERGERAP